MSDEDERRIAEIEADLREQARYSVVIGTIDGLPGWVTFAFPPAHTGRWAPVRPSSPPPNRCTPTGARVRGAGSALSLIDDAAEDAVLQIVGHRGDRRYLRVSFDFTGTHTIGLPIASIGLRGHPKVAPAA